MVFSLFAGERQGLALALPAKIHSFRLRCAPCGTVVPLKVTLGKSAILPRFITHFWVQRHAAACAALRAEQSFHSKCAHRKVRFSVAGNHTIVFLRRAAHLPNCSTTLYQTQKLTFKVIRTFAFSPQAFYPIYFNFYIYFFFYFFFYLYLEKKKGCGGEEEGGTQCFTRMISP